MNISELAETINGTLLVKGTGSDQKITTGYCCDLLSHVMADAPQNCAWMTVLTHTNIVAVAELANIGCIVVPEGIEVTQSTLDKAEEENVPIISTVLGSYEISWRLHQALEEE